MFLLRYLVKAEVIVASAQILLPNTNRILLEGMETARKVMEVTVLVRENSPTRIHLYIHHSTATVHVPMNKPDFLSWPVSCLKFHGENYAPQ